MDCNALRRYPPVRVFFSAKKTVCLSSMHLKLAPVLPTVCNFQMGCFQSPSCGWLSASNAPRRASEAIGTVTASKYFKIGALGFYALFCLVLGGFSTGKAKTSEFFEVKCRCFACKVRRFVSKMSDVFRLETRYFPYSLPSKHGFNGKICLPPPFPLWKRYFVLLSICSNISQFGRDFTLEGTRSLVRIFEVFFGGYPFSFC